MGRTLRRSRRPPLYRDLERLLAMVCEMTDRAYKRSRASDIFLEMLLHQRKILSICIKNNFKYNKLLVKERTNYELELWSKAA